MKGHSFGLFRWFLLLCVMLNLGDAPYVDEIFANGGGQLSVLTLATAGHADASSVAADTGKTKRSPYENLLSNVPLPAEDPPAMIFPILAGDIPTSASFHIPLPHGSRIERPPRTTTPLSA